MLWKPNALLLRRAECIVGCELTHSKFDVSAALQTSCTVETVPCLHHRVFVSFTIALAFPLAPRACQETSSSGGHHEIDG